jgi:hypothetical protein
MLCAVQASAGSCLSLGRYIGTSIVSIKLLLKLSARVVDFMSHRQSVSFGEEKIFLSQQGIRFCRISRVYSETELFCKDSDPPDPQT